MYLIQSAKKKKKQFQEIQIFQVVLIKISFLLVFKKFKPSYDFMLPQATIFCILYIIIFEVASWYMYVPNHEKKISKRFTVIWHLFFISTTFLYSLLLANKNPVVYSHYFKVRICLYCYCFTNLVNNLHVVKNPVIYQKTILSRFKQYWMWQLKHYKYPLYCIIFGFFLDFISFGTYLNLILFVTIFCLTIGYKIIKYFIRINGWQKLKTTFTIQ